jgi:hypothetical protein
MDTIKIWKINHSFDKEMIDIIDKNENMPTQLLDLSKKKYSLFEKFVYDVALFHFKQLNIDITSGESDYYVEFWCKNKFDTHRLHVDCDEYKKKQGLKFIHPLLSCVTYLNDNPCPTIITNIDMEMYKYKEFENQKELFLSMPKCNKQIIFDGKYFHGSTLLSDNDKEESRYIIAINLWDKRPTNVEYYISNTNIDTNLDVIFVKEDQCVSIEKTSESDNIKVINVCKKTINYNLYEDILYTGDEKACYIFKELIKNIEEDDKTAYKFVLDTTIEKKQIDMQLKNKYGDIMDDINEIMNENNKLKYNRFLQRFHYTKIYTPDICHFIINESERYAEKNGGWTTKRHHNYPTTDLPVEKIASIFGLVLQTMKTVVTKVKKSFGLHDDIIINIQDLFVVKYKDSGQNYLDMHHDGSFLSFNILLSDKTEFEGGGTYFDDGLTAYLEQGDILIHSSRIKHAGLPITKGTRYLLVGFLNIDIPLPNNT